MALADHLTVEMIADRAKYVTQNHVQSVRSISDLLFFHACTPAFLVQTAAFKTRSCASDLSRGRSDAVSGIGGRMKAVVLSRRFESACSGVESAVVLSAGLD